MVRPNFVKTHLRARFLVTQGVLYPPSSIDLPSKYFSYRVNIEVTATTMQVADLSSRNLLYSHTVQSYIYTAATSFSFLSGLGKPTDTRMHPQTTRTTNRHISFLLILAS